MTLANEYINQNIWRNWISYIKMLPIKDTDIILDLGCGTGHVAKTFIGASIESYKY